MISSLFTDDNLNILRADGTPDPDVWGIGDAAMVEGLALPATAQGALRSSFVLEIKAELTLFIWSLWACSGKSESHVSSQETEHHRQG